MDDAAVFPEQGFGGGVFDRCTFGVAEADTEVGGIASAVDGGASMEVWSSLTANGRSMIHSATWCQYLVW